MASKTLIRSYLRNKAVAKGRLKQIAEKHQVDRHMLLQRAINPKAHSARLIQVIEIPVVSSAMQSLVTSSFSSPSTSMRLAPSIEADNKETPLPRMGLRFQTLARTQTSSLGRIRIALFKRLEGAIQALGENPTEEDFQKVADSSSYELETLKNYREALQELRKGEPYDQETNQLQKKITATAALYSIDAIYLNQLYQKPKK